MQGVIAVPEMRVLRRCGDPEKVLMQEVAGVPLLLRVVVTAARAGISELLLVWPDELNERIWDVCASSPILPKIDVQKIRLSRFDPRRNSSWAAVFACLQHQFVWVPRNFVTQSRTLAAIEISPLPLHWDRPVRLRRVLLGRCTRKDISAGADLEGVPVRSQGEVLLAEDFLVRHSGKATDNFYSKFNRWLCRPVVLALSHTPVTPNVVTLAGLVAAIISACLYSRGCYRCYVAGALLFFLSGLIDEMDGMLARLKFRESAFGTWFEGTVDNVTYLLLFVGITLGLFRQSGRGELVWGIALITGCVLAAVAVALQRRSLTARDRPHEYAARINRLLETDSNPMSRVARRIHIFIRKAVAIHFILIFTVIGALPIFLRMAALAATLTWTLAFFFTWKFTQNNRVSPFRPYSPQPKEIA